MTAQDALNPNEKWFLAKALSIPVLGLLLAIVLIYIGPTANAGTFPEIIGGENLRRGLRTMAIPFGLSCFPGGLAGVALGSLIVRNGRLASALLHVLRIGQWVPFVVWWALVPLLLVAPGERQGRYFFVWTMCVPAGQRHVSRCFVSCHFSKRFGRCAMSRCYARF